MNIKNYNSIHFIGIGGISMSGLAKMLKKLGCKITGSDAHETEISKELRLCGIEVYIGQKEENISADTDLAVYTAAISEDNPEIQAAKKRNIKLIDRAELLSAVMSGYKYPICVSGTHGKTTTTSMVGDIFFSNGLDPTIFVGGYMASIRDNYRYGESDYCIVEACEYFDSFLKFKPHVGIILNIDCDHLDYFGTFENIQLSFRKFAQNIPDNGVLVINSEIADFEKITEGLRCKVVKYGKTGWHPKNISMDNSGCGTFDAYLGGEKMGSISLGVPGEHNIYNSLAACAAAYELGMALPDIAKGLGSFRGTGRRLELKGKRDGFTVMDDYAHHPTEIKAALAAVKTCGYKNITCVFQPHNFSRTLHLMDDFAAALCGADKIVLLDIYTSRENYSQSVHSKDLAEKIKALEKDVYYMDSFEAAKQFLLKDCGEGDLLITMGAGDVYKLGDEILQTEL